MNKFFYLRLAIDNIRKNKKMFIPYLLMSILTTLTFYMETSLANNPNILDIKGGKVISQLLGWGMPVIGIFAIIFLFYTYSFLIKKRKREFGLFNILGMEKKHLARVIGYETILTFLISMVFGIGLGILLDKVFYLIIVNILSAEIALGFYVSTGAIITTVFLFLFIYVLIYLFSLLQINLSNPIELLRSDKTGEREPKTKWFMALLGLVCLGAGYYIAVSIKDPISALVYFFVAVILVIIGTYFLFVAGSIVILKLLRKNKNYYYKTNHFISVSNMIYRMKQNAVGLANICVLSTMILVMLSSTIALWSGVQESIDKSYPNDVTISYYSNDPTTSIDRLKSIMDEKGIQIKDLKAYNSLTIATTKHGDTFSTSIDMNDASNLVNLTFLSVEDLNALEHTQETLASNEVLVYCDGTAYDQDQVKIFNDDFVVKKAVSKNLQLFSYTTTIHQYYVVVDSLETLNHLYEEQVMAFGDNASYIVTNFNFNLANDTYTSDQAFELIKASIVPGEDGYLNGDTKEGGAQGIISLYAGLLFIGIFLSTLFIMATALIMYYKQISEGYEDKKRFEIMQNVGLEKREVKRTINSQVLTVFFLPLVVAAIHIVFAYPLIEKLLQLLFLSNSTAYILTTVGCFGVFSLVYILIYFLTSKTYYGIVKHNI